MIQKQNMTLPEKERIDELLTSQVEDDNKLAISIIKSFKISPNKYIAEYLKRNKSDYKLKYKYIYNYTYVNRGKFQYRTCILRDKWSKYIKSLK